MGMVGHDEGTRCTYHAHKGPVCNEEATVMMVGSTQISPGFKTTIERCFCQEHGEEVAQIQQGFSEVELRVLKEEE